MRYIYALFLFTLSFSPLKAQDILAQEISYPYLDKLIEVAKKNYPRLKLYESRVEAGSYAEKKARLSYFEILSFSYLYSPDRLASSINPNFLNGYQFGFFVNIGSLLQKPSLIKQAKSELKALEYDRDSYQLSLEADVKRRYFSYVQFKMLLTVKANALQDVSEVAEELKVKFEKGESSFEEYSRAQVVISDRLQSKIAAEADVLISKATLEELLGQKLEDIQ
ncbi:TolC family protein [Dyadobacter arcticus]|uniref:Outer membrane protein TolC n=1 Tax=Dyadobacter arcticus TaxID=1078754 RepID=A0ABX0UKU9_9BACT|nr:TolC family protein [Dyadobacter arcticus]NIJ53641.1 outer membrane protein TolC [Dyadobacter arcticus]